MMKQAKLDDGSLIPAAKRYLEEVYHVTYFPIIAIVYAMACAPERTYPNVLWYWSQRDHKILGWPKYALEQWHAEICRQLLKSGADVDKGVEHWFNERAKEVRGLED